VKETLFGILADRVIDARVLDLYAGSGSVGIEALSRGAASCDFVEHDRRAIAAIRENLERAGVAEHASVHTLDVMRFLERPEDVRFGLAFVDPPYAERAILAPLERLVAHLAPGAMVVVKHHWRTEIPLPEGLSTWRVRRFGETSLTFLAGSDGADEVEE
jgi:16S rRNA (guanine966-N2)-methyltransferase